MKRGQNNALVNAGNEGMAKLASLLCLEGLDDDGLASGVSARQQDDDLARLDAARTQTEGALEKLHHAKNSRIKSFAFQDKTKLRHASLAFQTKTMNTRKKSSCTTEHREGSPHTHTNMPATCFHTAIKKCYNELVIQIQERGGSNIM